MLYLFGSGSWEGNLKVLKIGYTSDIDIRKSQYKLHNPLGKFISTREGDEILETKMHLRLIHSKTDFLDEWFYDEKDVYDVFDLDEEEIDKWIWDNRAECLLSPIFPSPDSMKWKILKELERKYNKKEETEYEKFL